jgi:plastocyanin
MRSLAPLLTLLAVLATAAPAVAETRTETFRYGPITVSGYAVKQQISIDIPKPSSDAWIKRMEVDVVDPDGTPVSIQRLMLHHIVFNNVGSEIGSKHDATCNTITTWDSQTSLPAIFERFYAAGEERAVLDLPESYGYKSAGKDSWAMLWMMMNHRPTEDSAFIQYKVTYETEPRTEVTPYWLDVRNCNADPVYDVPGGGKRDHVESSTWTPPHSGRLVAGGGHVHGGGKALRLAEPGCGNRSLAVSRPRWGDPDHPFYNVKPVLHEPGPVAMSGFKSVAGIPVSGGKPLRLDSIYDGTLPHTRVMGIYQVFLAKGETGTCEPLPGDVTTEWTVQEGRSETPKVRVPLTGLDANGNAIEISKPPGKTVRLRRARRANVKARGLSFNRPNLSVRRGAKVTWTFPDQQLHNITVASGPRGFSSTNLSGGRFYAKKLNVPGTYRLFCALHPVDMTQRLIVR